jgi:hypothetical protein
MDKCCDVCYPLEGATPLSVCERARERWTAEAEESVKKAAAAGLVKRGNPICVCDACVYGIGKHVIYLPK